MAKKRSHEEIENIDDVDGPMSSTSIHGAVVTLSPVKKGQKAMFFDGLLEDETSQIRLVGFQGMQQQKLNDYHQKNIAVVLENCEVKAARQGEGYKVMLKSSTAISQEVGCCIVDGWHRNSVQNCNTFVTWELGCVPESHSEHQGCGTKGWNASWGESKTGCFCCRRKWYGLS